MMLLRIKLVQKDMESAISEDRHAEFTKQESKER